jgi:hypothetical protein
MKFDPWGIHFRPEIRGSVGAICNDVKRLERFMFVNDFEGVYPESQPEIAAGMALH